VTAPPPTFPELLRWVADLGCEKAPYLCGGQCFACRARAACPDYEPCPGAGALVDPAPCTFYCPGCEEPIGGEGDPECLPPHFRVRDDDVTLQPPQSWTNEELGGALLGQLWRIYDAGGISNGRSHEAVLLEAASDVLQLSTPAAEDRPRDKVMLDEAQRRRLARPIRTHGDR
jgi:hypothetical protein